VGGDRVTQNEGWYNVTEDADRGIRLARMGFRSVMFDSTTHEEAPIRFGAWLRQRSRWMKGWMQTWGVYMRAPARLWREAGGRGFLTLNILIGGNVFTALAYPFLISGVIADLAVRTARRAGLAAVRPADAVESRHDRHWHCGGCRHRPARFGPAESIAERLVLALTPLY
jgi:hypothetical protein